MVLTILLQCFTVLFVFLKSKSNSSHQNSDLKVVFSFFLTNFLLHIESLHVFSGHCSTKIHPLLRYLCLLSLFLTSDGHLKCF